MKSPANAGQTNRGDRGMSTRTTFARDIFDLLALTAPLAVVAMLVVMVAR